MKLTGILLLAAFLHVSARSTAQRLSISVRNGSLERVFSEIEKKTNYVFFYDASVLQKSKPVTVDVKDASVEDVLRISLKGQGLDFTIQDKTIFVKREKEGEKTGAGAPAVLVDVQDGPVVVVTSETGTPLAGATVVIKSLKKQGMTNEKGEFSLKGVPNGEYEVEVTNVGFEKHILMLKVADPESRLAIRMKQAMNGLDEMVVKGYYNTTKRLNTGDVSKVKGEDIQKQPVSDPILALQARVPGLYIQQSSGLPGSYSVVRIRGQSSIANGNDPLYIVDGVPFSSTSLSSSATAISALGRGNSISNATGSGVSPFNSLNPADIESVEVLKDADATAIYGSRGANGVILITTRKGKSGDTRFVADLFSGEGKVAHKLKLLNTPQYLAMRREAFQNDGLPFPDLNSDPSNTDYDVNGVWDTTRNTDWQKVIMGRSAQFTNAQGTLSGGNNNTQFVIGGGYSNQATVFPGNYSDKKAMAHFNITHTSADHRFGAIITTSYVNDNDNLPTTDFTSYITLAPDAPALKDNQGNINWQLYNGTGTFGNVLGLARQTAKANTNNLIANLNLRYQLLPGLDLKSGFGYSRDEMNETGLRPASASAPPNNNNPALRRNTFANTTFSSWIVEPQISYQKGLGQGKLEMLVGTSFQENRTNSLTQLASGFVSDALISNPQAASSLTLVGASNILYRYTAMYGRIGYNWQEKYILNLTARRDGSSRFGPGKQFGDFGAIGAAWIFSKEKFIENFLPFLSFGKLRASYGTSGNDQIPDYQFLSTYGTFTSSTYQGTNGLVPTRLTNPVFAWEVQKKLEGGIEIGLLNDRVLISANYFRNRTGNQLVGFSLPYLSGFASVQYNLPAVVQNTGIELTLNATCIKSKNFEWVTSINATIPNNKLVSFPNLANFAAYSGRYVVGQSLFIQKVYHNTGVDPQTGTYSFAAKDGSGIPSYPQDVIISKPLTQRLYGGIQNRISYKGFSVDFLIQYVNQVGFGYQNAFALAPGSFNYNQPTAVVGRWQQKGNFTAIQAYGTDYGNANSSYGLLESSDAVITDASFLRLKNLQIAYQMPAKWRSRVRLQNLTIYLQCQNVFTVTHYLGLNPEAPGNITLPPLRVITAGLQLGL